MKDVSLVSAGYVIVVYMLGPGIGGLACLAIGGRSQKNFIATFYVKYTIEALTRSVQDSDRRATAITGGH